LYAAAKVGTTGTVPSMTTEENPAQHQNSQPLPEGNLAPAEEHRQQPVPQVHDYFTADEDEKRYSQKRQRRNPKQSFSSAHVSSLMLS
jgi:hypothetical protein